MFTINSRTLSRAAIAAGFAIATAGAFLTADADPAMALCKYGTPHCVHQGEHPTVPTSGGAKLPPSGWVDPDCKYFGNCDSSEVKGTAISRPHPTTGTGTATTVHRGQTNRKAKG